MMVVIEYPKYLHHLHDDFPSAAEIIKIGEQLVFIYSNNPNIMEQKLMKTLSNQTEYVCH